MSLYSQLNIKTLAVSVLVFTASNLAAEEILESNRHYGVSKTRTLLSADQLGTIKPELQMGSLFIVSNNDLSPAQLAEKTHNSELTLMEAGPDSFAISDATVVVITRDRTTLSQVFLDYELTMVHEFSATYGAVAQLATVAEAEDIIERLKTDSRIKSAQLNLQTFDDSPQ